MIVNGGKGRIRAWLAAALLVTLPAAHAADAARPAFKRILTQFIAALAEPGATSGNGAEHWGLWVEDPGPRGVMLSEYPSLRRAGGIAPEGWKFDPADWWLEENGLIMEPPKFPLPPKKYLVTGGREVSAVLTIHVADATGNRRWELDRHATIHDVTHLACRSARYRPAGGAGSCTPGKVKKHDFPVDPGAAMPPVEGCAQQDYAVLLVVGVAD